jgi:hypothetical protein
LTQEVVGYEVEMKGPGAGTVNGFFALAGCRKPMDSQDPDCDGGSVFFGSVTLEIMGKTAPI